MELEESLPHLHMHLCPRCVRDAFEEQPINPRIVKGSVYAPGEFADFVAQVQRQLGQSKR